MNHPFAIFDMDGTLVDSMPYWHRLGAEYLVSQGIAPPHDLSARLETMTLMEAADYFISELGVVFGKEDIMRQLNDMIEGHYRRDIPLKPHAKAYLQALHEQGVRMCVATASSEELCQSCFARLGILPYFARIYSCETLGIGKHSPQIFLQAARDFGAAPLQIAVYEDALYAAKTAKQAGFYVVGVYDESAQARQQELKQTCDVYIRSFAELL